MTTEEPLCHKIHSWNEKQENATLVENSQQTAAALSEQGRHLSQLVSVFKISER